MRTPAASANVATVTRTFARRALISAAALLALGTAAAESPGAILKRALAAKPCPAFETAQGWIIHRVSPPSELTGAASDQITAVDRSRRRFVSMIRQVKPGEDTVWRVTRYAYGDGQFFACTAERAETCKLQPLAQADVPPEDITSAWVGLGDLRASDHGGAAIALADVPAGIVNAVAAVSLTPQGGRPYILYIAEDGAIVATDMQAPEQTVRTWLGDFKDIAGCSTPSSMRVEILPAMAGKYLEWRLQDFEYRDWMAPEDTAFD